MPGLEGWTYATGGFHLPDGCPDRANCKIVSQPDPQHLEVEAGGSRWVLPWSLVTCGDEYRTRRGKWVREPDKRVREYVLKRLEWAKGLDPAEVPERDRRYWIDHYEWVLARNGWS